MDKYKFLFLFLCFVLSLLSCNKQNKTREEVIYDAGGVDAGIIIKHDFKLSNEEQTPLTIIDVISSCSCTTSNIVKGITIQPQESIVFTISFSTEGLSGMHSNFVLLKTSSKKHPIKAYIISCKIREFYSYSPKILDYGDLKQGDSKCLKITLWDLNFENLEILDISSDSSCLQWIYHKIIGSSEDGNREGVPGIVIDVSLIAPNNVGTFLATLKILTSSCNSSVVNIPIKSNIHSSIYSQPSQLAFGIISPKTNASLDFCLHGINEDMFHSKIDCTCDLQYVDITRLYSKDDLVFRVTIDTQKSPRNAPILSKIYVNTVPPIEIPFSFLTKN
jgi:hypothetical protein